MAHTPHELAEEFPEHTDAIHRLKMSDAHFARLVDQYHHLNRAIHRAEARVAPTDDLNEEDMRKLRLLLKDEIAATLRRVAAQS